MDLTSYGQKRCQHRAFKARQNPPEFCKAGVDFSRQRFHFLAIEHYALAEISVVNRSVPVPD